MNNEEVLEQIESYIEIRKSQNLVAKDLGVSAQYLSDVRKRKRAIGPKILRALGLRKSVMFLSEPKSKARKSS